MLQTFKSPNLVVMMYGFIAGAGQRKSSFWKAIEHNYNAQKGPMYLIRTLRSLEGRWFDIKEQANKFESHYNNILNERRSGYSDMDKVRFL